MIPRHICKASTETKLSAACGTVAPIRYDPSFRWEQSCCAPARLKWALLRQWQRSVCLGCCALVRMTHSFCLHLSAWPDRLLVEAEGWGPAEPKLCHVLFGGNVKHVFTWALYTVTSAVILIEFLHKHLKSEAAFFCYRHVT